GGADWRCTRPPPRRPGAACLPSSTSAPEKEVIGFAPSMAPRLPPTDFPMTFHEIVAPDEEARFERYAAELRARQKLPSRALHAKQHVGVEGRLEVGELPAPLRVAVFAQPRTWPVYVRFSNGAPRKQRDPVPDVRGIALKLRGLPGRK